MTQTPISLLERLRSHPTEQHAWAQFVEIYTPLLFHWARRLGIGEPDASDLVQEVLLVLVRKLPTFEYDGRKSFRGWLRTVLRNKWLEGRRRPGLPREPGPNPLAEVAGPDNAEDFDEAEYRTYLVGCALKVMQAEFEPTTWRACWEFVVCGRPAAEVADELGLSVGTVYAAKCRVLCRLRQQLRGLLEE